jgi:hypothetical protein
MTHIITLNTVQKLLEVLWYFCSPQFFTNLTFIVTMVLVYLKHKAVLPFVLPLNLFILIIGSFISIFFIRSAMSVAMSRLSIPKFKIPRFSSLHIAFIILGIGIHVVMTLVLKWYMYKQFTSQEIQEAEDYGDKHRMDIVYSCVGIVVLYFLTGLYTVYGLNNTAVIGLFIAGPIVMYLCTYLDDYFYLPNRVNNHHSQN